MNTTSRRNIVTTHDKAINNVKSWDNLSAGDWFWVIVSICAALFTITMSLSTDLQHWFVRNGMDWVATPAFATIFWFVWYCISPDTLSTTLALIGTWYVNLLVVAIGLIVLAFSTGFGAMIANTVSFWYTNAPEHGALYFTLGLVGGLVAIWLIFRRGK